MTNSEALKRLKKLNEWLGDHESEAICVAIAALEALTPDWDNAPEWAEWWAIDEYGESYFYDEIPELAHLGEWQGRCEKQKAYFSLWRESLEKRPKNIQP